MIHSASQKTQAYVLIVSNLGYNSTQSIIRTNIRQCPFFSVASNVWSDVDHRTRWHQILGPSRPCQIIRDRNLTQYNVIGRSESSRSERRCQFGQAVGRILYPGSVQLNPRSTDHLKIYLPNYQKRIIPPSTLRRKSHIRTTAHLVACIQGGPKDPQPDSPKEFYNM